MKNALDGAANGIVKPVLYILYYACVCACVE